MITPSQALWAKGHDWFIEYDVIKGEVTCRSDAVLNGELISEETIHTDFKELKEWAGYQMSEAIIKAATITIALWMVILLGMVRFHDCNGHYCPSVKHAIKKWEVLTK